MLDEKIKLQLAQYQDPYTRQDLMTLKAIKSIRITPQQVEISLCLPYPHASLVADYTAALTAYLAPILEGRELIVQMTHKIDAHNGSQTVKGLSQIKNIIAIASGKGGVGKSTIAVNLALALAREGARVGMLDADIYGPSQPAMLGARLEKPIVKEGLLQPIERHGIQSMSIGYLIDEQTPMVWRGPMIGKAMQQLIHETEWQDLDYLIVDLPPGTGDIQLTLCQKMPVSGVVMVTTPQTMAVLDVSRACAMFQKLAIPMLGVVENMNHYTCSHCGHEEALFGQGGAKELADTYQLTVLASIPFTISLREQTDGGQPPAAKGEASFTSLAHCVAAKLALQPKDYSAKFPAIVTK